MKRNIFKKAAVLLVMLAMVMGSILPARAYDYESHTVAGDNVIDQMYATRGIGTWVFRQSPQRGDRFIIAATNQYTTENGQGYDAGSGDAIGYTRGETGWYAPAILDGTLVKPTWLSQTPDWQDWKSVYNGQTITTTNGNTVTVNGGSVYLSCIHECVDTSFNYIGGREAATVAPYVDHTYATNNAGVYCMIEEVDTEDGYMLVAMLVPTAGSQCGISEFKIRFTVQSTYDPIGILLKKKDAGTADDVRPVVL